MYSEKKDLTQNDLQTIISLNTQFVSLKKLDEIFEKISLYFENNFNINKLEISIEDNQLYKNFKENNIKSKKNLHVKLNEQDNLKISLFYTKPEELENIDKNFAFIKIFFEVISQTIYNKYLEFRLMELTVKDSLTGLYNRQFVDEYLKNFLPLSQRESKKIAFLKVGIDHFKAVIDEFNYKIGDKVLKELAKSLSNTVRISDIVARIDADEFLVILNNVSNEDDAIMVANKIIENFKNVKVSVDSSNNQTLKKTVCTGISIFPDDAKQIEEIFRYSDIALYEARNKGRSQCFKYKKDSDEIEFF